MIKTEIDVLERARRVRVGYWSRYRDDMTADVLRRINVRTQGTSGTGTDYWSRLLAMHRSGDALQIGEYLDELSKPT